MLIGGFARNRDAWYAQRGLSRTEAKRRYVSTLIDTMHRYASQTPEARELASELEFVWDQVKANTSSSTSSDPVHNLGMPPLSQPSYASIGGRLARSDYSHAVPRTQGDSRLRVLSPVSQPDEPYRCAASERRTGQVDDGISDESGEMVGEHDENVNDDSDDDEDEDEEEEEFEEARDSLDDNENNGDHVSEESGRVLSSSHRGSSRDGGPKSNNSNSNKHNRRWRRRVEQALTKMTAEIAAVREQMELRSLAAGRRRSNILAWIKWLVWVALRQVIWDLAILGMILIWMRIKGDRRLEEKLTIGWSEVKARLMRLNRLHRLSRLPSVF